MKKILQAVRSPVGTDGDSGRQQIKPPKGLCTGRSEEVLSLVKNLSPITIDLFLTLSPRITYFT